MREREFAFNTGLKGGLRRFRNNPTNSESLIEAYNVRVGVNGLENYEAIVDPFVGTPALTWPYLQVFNTSIGLYVVNRTDIYSVDGSYNLSSEVTVASRNQRWTLADFGRYMVFANGSTPVERAIDSGDNVVWQVSSATYTVNAVCNYNGQLVAGGFGSALNTVAWSRIGYADITNLLSLTIEDKTLTSGYKKMEWDGEIYQVMKLGSGFVVYGSGGISYMPAVEQPVPTFGYKNISGVGIAGRYAVAGNDSVHLWIDLSGFIWMMKADLKPVLLGYQEWIVDTDMIDNTIVVSHNPHKDDFYISDGETTYLCNEKGMSSIYQHPSSVVAYGGGVLGAGYSEELDHRSILASDKLDMGNKNIKTIQTIEADITSKDVFCAVDYKFSAYSDWATSKYKQFNKMGFVTPIVAGTDVRLRLKWTDYTEFQLSYILVRFKQTDRRSIRGTYAVPRGSVTYE